MKKYTNIDMKHHIRKSPPVYVPWGFLACLFGLVSALFVAVSFLLISPDDFRFYDLARFCGIAALPFAVLSVFCVYMSDERDAE